MRQAWIVVAVVSILFVMVNSGIAEEAAMMVGAGKEVAFHYTLTVDGQVADSSQGKEPLTYTHGGNQIIPGLEKALEGMKVGEKKSVTVAPEEAYGVVDPKAHREIPRASIGTDMEPQVGMALQARGPNGDSRMFMITEVTDTAVVIDMNHPLAGKTLSFDVEIVSIK